MNCWFIAVVCFSTLLLISTTRAEEIEVISGRAMGTSYTLKLASHSMAKPTERIKKKLAEELERIEAIFSLYRPDSELSRWNDANEGVWFEVSADLFAVCQFAIELSRKTDGAFDPTIRPLMKLWDLDSLSSDWKPPDLNAILDSKKQIGVSQLELQTESHAILKRNKMLQLDLNALVEGWTIDRIALMLQSEGFSDFMFELGGEFGSSGKSDRGTAWTVGIEDPNDHTCLISRVALNGESLCTSGSTKQGRQFRSKRYSHIIDPRTGCPIEHDLAAVSVIHSNAMIADGWATALMVLGPEQGPLTAEQNGLIASFTCVKSHRSQVQLSRYAKDRFELKSEENGKSTWNSRYMLSITCAVVIAIAAIVLIPGIVYGSRRTKS